MKKQTVNSIAKMFFLGNLMMAFVFMASLKASAQTIKDTATKAVATQDKVQVKYINSSDDGVFFSVKYNNVLGTSFNLSIVDDNGEVLYDDNFADRLFEKKFKINRSLDRVKFVIKNDKQKFEQSFSININTRLIEDFAVNKY